MENNSTIQEVFMLPSKGKVYDKEVNPVIELSSMTTWQEMKRMSPSDMPYKRMSDIIEECMTSKPSISVYDMCLGDYQYLLTKLRVITFGAEYKVSNTCPQCGEFVECIADLDSMGILEYDESYEDLKIVELPVCGDTITLTYQTPRKLDEINRKSKEMQRKTKLNIDFTLLFGLMSVIDKVNGNKMNVIQLEDYCKKLNMKDVNTILQKAEELNEKVGVDNSLIAICPNCGNEVISGFRITNEFFRPTN